MTEADYDAQERAKEYAARVAQRDVFAAYAMQAMLLNTQLDIWEYGRIAHEAYQAAEAMMEERATIVNPPKEW